MPHQCLKCGRIFEEGSSQLLRGCPDCGGNRFFFTKQPLGESERETITQEVNKDLNAKIMDLLVEKNKEVFDKKGKWISIKPKEIRKMIEEKISEEKEIKEEEKAVQQDAVEPIDDKHRKTVIEKIKAEIDKSDTPETIGIEQPGKYSIDLKGLLEDEPIVIQKDGTYIIHLPSVFKMINKEK
jgi:predicted  nucleic acid-binding Zn-ribbon protein